ncbi:MAG: hypothetical protein ACOCRN_02550 [Spirochaetia bacterium]
MPMFEIVDKITKAEQQAEQIVAEAREKAEKLRSDFDAEEQNALSEAQNKAGRIIQDRVDAVRREANERLREREAEEGIAEQFVESHPERVQETVKRVAEYIIAPEYER